MGSDILQIIIAIIGIVPGTFQAINEFFSRWENRNSIPSEPPKFKLIELTRKPYESSTISRIANQQIISGYIGIGLAIVYAFIGVAYLSKTEKTQKQIDEIEWQANQELSRFLNKSTALKDVILSNQIARIERKETQKTEEIKQALAQEKFAVFLLYATCIFIIFIAGFNQRIGSDLKQSCVHPKFMLLGDTAFIKIQANIKDREEAYCYVLDRCCKSLNYIDFQITHLNFTSGEIEAIPKRKVFYLFDFEHPKNRITIKVKKMSNFCFSILLETEDVEIYEARNFKERLFTLLKGVNTVNFNLHKNSFKINNFVRDFIS